MAAKLLIAHNNLIELALSYFSVGESCVHRTCPTKRAPDAGGSAQISSSFLRLSLFLAGRLRRPRPSAGNANRWAVPYKTSHLGVALP